jgi:hypothetical protein
VIQGKTDVKARYLFPVLCMIKRTPKILYGFKGKHLSLHGLYREIKKRRGRTKILFSAVVSMNDAEPARIVFVRDRKKIGWPFFAPTVSLGTLNT